MGKRANGEGSWSVKTIRGNKYHMYRATIDGVQKSFYGKTKKEALEKYNNYKIIPQVEPDTQPTSFYDYSYKWLYNYKKDKIKTTTFDYYDLLIEKFLKDTQLGNITIKKLNMLSHKESMSLFQSHINQYKVKSKSTTDSLHSLLNQVCKYGVTYQDFAYNFMQGVTKLSEKEVEVKKKEIPVLSYEEVMKLWDEMLRKNESNNIINNVEGTYVYGIGAYALLFCCFTGLRWGELSRLEWRDIKKDKKNWYFKVDKQFVTIRNRDNKSKLRNIAVTDTPKSEKSNRYIPLCKEAKKILELVKERYPEYYKDEHLIFSHSDKPFSNSNANRLLKAMCIRAGVQIVSPHALRHSFASILLNEDAQSLYAVSDLLGHSSPDVTYKKYIDIFEKNKVNAVSLFDKLDK